MLNELTFAQQTDLLVEREIGLGILAEMFLRFAVDEALEDLPQRLDFLI